MSTAVKQRLGPIDWIDHHLNPVFVKDVRAWLRSKKFLIVYFVAMALIQAVTLVTTAIPEAEIGKVLFMILSAGLGFFLVGVLPFLMHDRFTDELSSGSTELALISRMTPGQFVRGKIMSGIMASLLFLSAGGPSFTIAYMLGGVDLILLFYMIALLLFCAVLSMILAILTVCLSGRRRLKFLGLFSIFLGGAMCILIIFITESAVISGAYLEPVFWFVHAILAGYSILFALFLYASAVSRLSFETDNRDLRPRLALSALTVIPVLLGLVASLLYSWLVPSAKSNPDELLIPCILLSFAMFTLGSFFILTTPKSYSARVRTKASRVLLLRLFLYPGTGRLYAYILLHLIFFAGVSLLPELLFNTDEEVTLVLMTIAVITLPTGLGGCTFLHLGLSKLRAMRKRKLARGFTVVILFVIWGATAVLLLALVESNHFDRTFFVLHPITAIIYVGREESWLDFAFALVVHSSVLVPAMVYWVFEIVRAVREDLRLNRFEDGSANGLPEEAPANG